ncbi:MAG: hypothetical protein D6785_03535 [Planctomycetota bacterium]|nr:MAG: hypothetical protein D6785_03535 [Planctomycetota bacterium]
MLPSVAAVEMTIGDCHFKAISATKLNAFLPKNQSKHEEKIASHKHSIVNTMVIKIRLVFHQGTSLLKL